MKLKLYISIFFIYISLCSQAQTDTIRPKVGLVLSGGGAKGLAHIGALKMIEESGVKIDYIAGTSMGAIIGGLYASGYNAKQLDSIFSKTDFSKLIRDELPRDAKTFYEREQSEKYAISFPFDNFSLTLPTGISKGQNIYNLLAQLTQHVKTDDFSELKIPFFCIATDIETGQEVVLDHGNLAQSISASGAIPTFFRPVEINGQLLSDGGVVNNYPVEKLKLKNMDYIIGVDVQDSLYPRQKLKSGLEIMTQVSNFRTIKAMKTKRQKTDVYIRPDIRNFNVMSFEDGETIINEGLIATIEKYPELEKLASLQNHPKIEKKPVKIIDSIYIDGIQIIGNKTFPRNYIRGKLQIETQQKIAYDDLNNGLNNLSATGNFNRVTYNIESDNNNQNLIIKVEENENKTFIKLMTHYDDLYKSGLLVNLTHKSLFQTNDVTSFDLILGDNIRYNFDYFIDKGKYWSIGLKSSFNQFDDNVDFDFIQENSNIGDFNVNQINLKIDDFTNQVYIETYLFKDFRFGLGFEQKDINAKTETIIDDQNNTDNATVIQDSNLLSAYTYIDFDSFDDKFFPTKGVYFSGDFHFYFNDLNSNGISEFSIVKGQIGYVTTPLEKLTTRFSSELGFRLGEEDVSSLNFFLGGYGNKTINNFRPFYGYDFFSVSANSYMKGMIEVDYNFYTQNHLILSANYANVAEDIFSDGEWFSSPEFSGYAIGYGCKTIFGPIDVKYSYSPETGDSHWFFSLGYWF
ncbi:patatin-like phospholipase family protein [Flavobacterium sp. CS20]|uniref:patatin-like phospholipase family protein n=1 Tax=Flavobacterium sp. CS20 TaxID=2775246 RepID=UPI001B3A3B96|nr:patatin-like phospholipase family protein [Flavobacterium sp. CS20]QTY28011.1 patatin-like phospholipase family protein [Flavobacterium sp. CS20]